MIRGFGAGFGEALERMEQLVLGVAAVITIVAWMALLSGPGRPTRRALGLLAVLVVHFLPLLQAISSPLPLPWSVARQWSRWGVEAAWSVPGLLALLWALGWLATPRVARGGRAVAVLLYLALVGLTLYRHRPLALPEPLVEIVATPDGSTACGRTAAGVVYCMGNNRDGQLGVGDPSYFDRPRRIDALTPASRVFLTDNSSCVLIGPSTVRCLGQQDGARERQWEATSEAVIADLIVGAAGELVFVAPNGDIAAGPGFAAGPIAAETREHRQCCDTLWLQANTGEWRLHTPRTGQSVAHTDATSVACFRESRRCAPAWLANGRLHVSTADTALAVEVPADAELIDTPAGIDLRSATQRASCTVDLRGWSGREVLACTWAPLATPPQRGAHGSSRAAAILIELNRAL